MMGDNFIRTVFLVTVGILCFRATTVLSTFYRHIQQQFDVKPIGGDSGVEPFPSSGSSCAYPSDCRDIQECGQASSGVYRVFPFRIGHGFLVYCDVATDGGGWVVFQRRQDGSVDFYKGWQDYKDGFGNLNGEFWLGLEKINLLTSQRHYELLVNLGSFSGKVGSAKYSRFRVSDETDKYRLLAEHYSGNCGDSLGYHNGYQFTTFDSDNDIAQGNCASAAHGAWWYNACFKSNLNGGYVRVNTTARGEHKSLSWFYWENNYKPLQFAEMKIRPMLVQ